MSDNTTFSLLLVEDNPGDADLAVERLTDVPGHDFQLVQASRLQEAIKLLSQRSFDAVILDLSLPDSQGINTLRRLRAAHPNVPCIVLSGSYSEATYNEVIREGAQDYIGKNDSVSRLLARSILYALSRTKAQHEQRQLEKIVASNPDAVLLVDAHGVVLFVNDSALKLFGRRREDFVGELIGFSVHEGTITELEIMRGGKVLTAEMHVVQIDWDGKPAYLASIRDTTAQKKLADQLRQAQKMEAIGQLAGGIAHDFNNLLAAISGNAELARGDVPEDHPVQESLEAIQQATSRAVQIVRQILVFSRQRDTDRQVVSIEPIIEETLRFLRATLPANVEICLSSEHDLPAIMADSTQIHQIFMNLGSNAAHAMRDQGGRLDVHLSSVMFDVDTLTISPDLRDGRYLRVSVSDTGHGMDYETLQHIFDPFFTTKSAGEGTGLGLSVVHGIMKSHEGAATVYSELGRGTVFNLYFPAIDIGPSTTHIEEEEIMQGHQEMILYVDDERQLVSMMTRMLQRNGYNAVGYDNPEEALEMFRAAPHQFAAAVVDRSMPRMDGPELVRHLHEIRSNLPVIMITGYLHPSDATLSASLNLKEVMLKPISFKRLAEVLNQTLHS